MSISRFYLFFYVVLCFLIAFVWSTYRVYKQTGINPITFSKTDSAHNYAGQIFKLLSVIVLVVVGIYAFFHHYYSYLIPIWYLENHVLKVIGCILLHICLLWIVIAQLQMGKSWRIGIDDKNKTTLVTEGIFNLSRNPIFLGMILLLLGLFLIIPNTITLLILSMSYVILNVQIRLEEEHLLKLHGERYLAYQKRVRRWI